MEAYKYGLMPEAPDDAAALIVSKLAHTGEDGDACDIIKNWCKVFNCSEDFLGRVAFNLNIDANPKEYGGGWEGVMTAWCNAHKIVENEWRGVSFYKPDSNLKPALFFETILKSIYTETDEELIPSKTFFQGDQGKEEPLCRFEKSQSFGIAWTWFKEGEEYDEVEKERGDFVESYQMVSSRPDAVEVTKYEYMMDDYDSEFLTERWKWTSSQIEDVVKAFDTNGNVVFHKKLEPDSIIFPNPPPNNPWKDMILGRYSPPPPPIPPELPEEYRSFQDSV